MLSLFCPVFFSPFKGFKIAEAVLITAHFHKLKKKRKSLGGQTLGLKSWLPSVHCIFCMLMSALFALHQRWKKHHHVHYICGCF